MPLSDPTDIGFDEQFRTVMRTGQTAELLKLTELETGMSAAMNALLSSRDAELDKLRDICEAAVEQTKGATDLEEHSYNLSMLNEKLRVRPVEPLTIPRAFR